MSFKIKMNKDRSSRVGHRIKFRKVRKLNKWEQLMFDLTGKETIDYREALDEESSTKPKETPLLSAPR